MLRANNFCDVILSPELHTEPPRRMVGRLEDMCITGLNVGALRLALANVPDNTPVVYLPVADAMFLECQWKAVEIYPAGEGELVDDKLFAAVPPEIRKDIVTLPTGMRAFAGHWLQAVPAFDATLTVERGTSRAVFALSAFF